MCGRLDSYLLSFSHLKIEKDSSKWPHQTNCRSPLVPLFLLTLIDQIHMGSILRNFVSLTVELQNTYGNYLQILQVPASEVSAATPFVSLSKADFWELVPQPGTSPPIKMTKKLISEELFRSRYLGGRFSEDLYMLLQMPHLRIRLRKVLIDTYFTSEIQDKLTNQSNEHWLGRPTQ